MRNLTQNGSALALQMGKILNMKLFINPNRAFNFFSDKKQHTVKYFYSCTDVKTVPQQYVDFGKAFPLFPTFRTLILV